ncbi:MULTISPECIES: adenylate/guanylate cyclase domain-containing protein [Agrobacterium]|uniref:Adenylate/guanylate cyclase domain-containing protein n=1 Tax=Agrobacterium tumefaciens TaxID=358 RepID=A0AAE6BH30_AGRTU|nr:MULTISPECIES: adenylate/guanylate cyclase domain-containing protein [Agrobacterium]QCL76866.1 adenylate/guanylate cyclase domain-containing protein [Agrobacterium tumefaciens]QCL82372.1 adenylate/guanylate cyclase domain-containing protein [Agrobacterium tumefaciens]CUX70546.1 Guanylate cyclase [Agrobacterium sp. NCPPB 925]
MALLKELKDNVSSVFSSSWSTRDGRVVPAPEDLKLSNDAIVFERATVLYADLTGSTNMVDVAGWQKSAEIYKTFLYCSGRIIRNMGGTITSYDGDRVMGVFIGEAQCTSAVKAAMKINWAVQEVIHPAYKKQYPDSKIQVGQVVGVDTSQIRAARTGVRGDNDIVWVGRAANYAAKLTEIKQSEKTWITKDVYEYMHDEVKYGGNPPQHMWSKHIWTEHDRSDIYGSTWWWSID